MTILQNIKKHYAARAYKSYNCWRNSNASHGSNAKRNMHKKNTSMVNCTKKHPGQKHDTIYQEKCGSQYILHYLHYYCRSIQRIRVRTHKHRFGNSMHLPYPKIHFRSLFQSQAEIKLKYSSQMVTLISECTCPTLNMVQAS